MSEKEFLAYMPSGAEITSPEKFIEFYSEAYFYDPAARDLSLESRIEEILKSDTWSRRDVIDILRWKVGATSWDYEEEMVYHRWGAIDVHDLNDRIFGDTIETAPKSPGQEELEKKFFEKCLGASGIGPVYAITLLYFQSQGKYPIYDKYAHIALLRLQDPKPFFSEESLVTDKAHNEEFHSRTGNMGTRWEDYCKNYVEPLKSLFIFESVYRKDRRLDRALWAYGHLFNATKTNKKRVK